ncbi:F-box-like protein [Ceratobasidium sp. AG-Ba]|nr:F-box-like protein [Ceratobasidium sp. AG-Ba]QRW10580.1 F-box-like protein [Ceratobasidium sp. AG-Ba]
MVHYRHLALSCPDVIHAVFANLDQPDLARALRVCRTWNEWTDTLWESLPTLNPLLRLAFPFVFTKENEKYIQGVPLYQINRTRFTQLAKSVRHIDSSYTPSRSFFHDYNPDIPGRLLDACGSDRPLFPKLQSLRTQCRNDTELLGLLPLLSSSLSSLEVSVHHSAVDFISEFVDGIGEHATKLERLDISCQPRVAKSSSSDAHAQRELDSYVYIPLIGSTLFALSSTLRTLSIPGSCMSIDTFLTLARLPLLRSLTFSGPWFSEIHGDEWPELNENFHAFPSLQTISLPCPIPAASRLLAAIPDSISISRVEVDSPSSHSGEELSELSMVLARFRASLRSIILKQPRGSEDEATLAWTAAFGAILECGALEELMLDLPLDMASPEAQTMSSRLRGLKVLRLPSSVLSSEVLECFSNMKSLRELGAFGGLHNVMDGTSSPDVLPS